MEKISWTNCDRNEEALHSVNEERNIVHTIKRRLIGSVTARAGNCLLKHIRKGKVEGEK
jgi:hypothetical protein